MKRARKRANKFHVNFFHSKRGKITMKRKRFNISSESDKRASLASTSQASTTQLEEEPNLDNEFESHDDVLDDGDAAIQSTYERRKEKLADHWGELRASLIRIKISTHGYPPIGASCICCGLSNAMIRCNDCGPNVFYCSECAISNHTNVNVMHRLFTWKEEDRIYMPFHRDIYIKKECSCSTTYNHNITCLDVYGCYHSVIVTFCSCESEAETLLKAFLFPATPKRPHLAFSFALLDWLEALMLESHVSAKDFTDALGMLTDKQLMMEKKRSIYPVIIEQYRFIKHEVRGLKSLISIDNTCPACSQNDEVYLSFDANFGLCRKRSAGRSVHPPLHSETLFFKQKDVNEFVENYGSIKSQNVEECNQFLAGNVLRSKTRFKALDETALAGIVCRHGIPVKFFSLCHGERLSYIVFALEKMMSMYQEKKVFLLYDIACLLQKHLRNKNRLDLLNLLFRFFTVMDTKWSARYLNGCGLTDGEVVERLWAYLRRYSRMTKEMRPSHRIDILSDALLHYASNSVRNLHKLLVERMARAKDVQVKSKACLQQLMDESPVGLEADDPWDFKYFQMLQSFYVIRKDIISMSQNAKARTSLTSLQIKQSRLDAQLKKIEKDKGFVRWSVTSDVYKDMQQFSNKKQKEKTSKLMAACARERWFLLKLKTKFADGQYLASRLSQSITKETSKLKSLLVQYNDLLDAEDEKLEWADVNNLSSAFWYQGLFQNNIQVPKQIKLKAIEHYHLILRADEEIRITKNEMIGTITFYLKKWKEVTDAVAIMKDQPGLDMYASGCINLLQLRRLKFEILINKLSSAFHNALLSSTPTIPLDDFLMSKLSYAHDDAEDDIGNVTDSEIEDNEDLEDFYDMLSEDGGGTENQDQYVSDLETEETRFIDQDSSSSVYSVGNSNPPPEEAFTTCSIRNSKQQEEFEDQRAYKPTVSISDNESECSDGMEYALRAKARLEKAEYLEEQRKDSELEIYDLCNKLSSKNNIKVTSPSGHCT